MSDPSTALPPDPRRVPRSDDDVQVVIIGGGPGGYEAALTAARQGARTTLVADRGVGGEGGAVSYTHLTLPTILRV